MMKYIHAVCVLVEVSYLATEVYVYVDRIDSPM